MDGKYGDSTRSVKAVGSRSCSGTADRSAAGSGVDVPPLARRDGAAGQLRPQLQSDLAPAGVGAGRTRGRRHGADVRLGHGGDHVGAAGARQAGHEARGARRRLLPGAPICAANTLRRKGSRSSRRRSAEMCAASDRRRRGAGRDAGQPGAGRRRPAPTGDERAAARGAILVVDNTTATPLGQQPLSLGADLVVASATKALSGHSDLLAGYVAGSQPELMAAVERGAAACRADLGAFEAWLVLRSLGSAGLRFERQCQNAQALALMLRAHPAVKSVRYPGLPEDPSHAIAVDADEAIRRPVSRRAGRRRGGARAGRSAVRCWSRRPASAASTPRWTAGPGGATRSRDGFARISLGIEDTDDLIADIEQALG